MSYNTYNLRHGFYNMIFKIKHKLYVARGSARSGVAQWLRHCATSRAVSGSNPCGVGHRDFSRGYRQNHVPWGQLSSKKWIPGIPLGVKAAGVWGWRPTTLVVPNVKKSGALTYPNPLGPSRWPVVGENFTFTRVSPPKWKIVGARLITTIHFRVKEIELW